MKTRIALKSLKYLAVVVIALAALLTAYFYIGGIEWGDWTIPDEAELRLEKVNVADEDNAYLALIALTNICTIVKDEVTTDESGGGSPKTMSDIIFVRYYGNPFNVEDREKCVAVRNDSASLERAAKILKDNAGFFAAFGPALSKKGFAAPDFREPGEAPSVSNIYQYKPLVVFAQLVRMKVQVELDRGDMASALTDIRDLHALGQMMCKVSSPCRGSFVEYISGEFIRNMAYDKMRDAVAMGKATDEALAAFVKMIDEDDASAPSNRERALKAEWEWRYREVDWLCDRTYPELIDLNRSALSGGNGASPENLALRVLWRWPGIKSFAWHRREMMFLQAAALRAVLADKADSFVEDMASRRHWWTALTPGGVGRIWITCALPILEPFFKEEGLARARVRLILAAEKWRRAHGGKNPPSLDALVPDYLAAVPSDPWDKAGGPLKYDAALGVAWSVGRDGKYDYRKIAKGSKVDGVGKTVDEDTQTYAFRLDGRPIDVRALTVEGMVVPPSSENAKTLEEAVRIILVQAGKQIGAVSTNGVEKLTMPYQQLGDGKGYEMEWRNALRYLLTPVGYNFTEDGDLVLFGLAEEVDIRHKQIAEERLAANRTPILFTTNESEGGMTLKAAIRDVSAKADVTITTDYMEPEDLYDPILDSMSNGRIAAEDIARAKSLDKQSKVKRTTFDTKGKLIEWRVVLREILNPHGYGFEEVYGIVRIDKLSKFAQWRQAAIAAEALDVERLQTEVARKARFMRLCRAAERGDVQAQLDVGLCFCTGDGVDPDFDKAQEWYCKAAAAHDAKTHLDWGWGDCLPRKAVAYADAKHYKVKQERLAANRTPILFTTNESEGGMELRTAIRDVSVKAGVTITTDYMEQGDLYVPAQDIASEGKVKAEGIGKAKQKAVVQQSQVKRTTFDTNGQQVEWRIVLREILGPHVYGFTEDKGVVRIAKSEIIRRWESDSWERRRRERRKDLLLYPAAVRGNAAARYSIGLRYADGLACARIKDLHAAVGWWLKAADQGNADAQYRLGACYLNGEGVEKDVVEAVRWWHEAAERNHADAQLRLGICYAQGDVVKTNVAEAVRWWLKAAELGNASACFRLGLCHEKGEGVAMDAHEAEKWYRRAAEMGNVDAKARLWDIQHEARCMSMPAIGGVAVAFFVILMLVTFLKRVRSKRGRQCGDSVSRQVEDNKVQDVSCAAHGQKEEGV